MQGVYAEGDPRAYHLVSAMRNGGSGPLRCIQKVPELIPERQGQRQFPRASPSKLVECASGGTDFAHCRQHVPKTQWHFEGLGGRTKQDNRA